MDLKPIADRLRRTRLLGPLALILLSVLSIGCRGIERVAPESVGLSSEKLAAVSDLIQEQVSERRLAGSVAWISRRGGLAYLEAIGLQDVDDVIPMSTDSIFRICSMTKPITSVAVMILVEEERISLSDPVSKFIPAFENRQVAVKREREGSPAKWFQMVDATREITIQDLLTHRSGLTYGFMDREYLGDLYQKGGVSDGLVETEGTIGDNIRRLAALPLMHQPGEVWEYSLSTDVLGHVVELVSGQSLARFFHDRIFEPLGMEDTHFELPDSKRDRLVTLYQPREDETIEEMPGGVIRRGAAVYSVSYPYNGKGYYSGGAGLVSTVPDYGRFLSMLLGGGEIDGVRILDEETVSLMTRDHCGDVEVWIRSHGNGFGLGFGVVTEAAADEGLGSVGTYSWGGFYFTYFWVDPEKELIGIVMSQLYPWDHMSLWDDFRRLTYAAITE